MSPASFTMSLVTALARAMSASTSALRVRVRRIEVPILRIVGYEDVWIVVRSLNSAERRSVVAIAESIAAENGRAVVLRETWDSTDGPLRIARLRRGRIEPAGART